MSYATDIMNIRCDDSAIREDLKQAFAEGHKQARHAAAEIATHADDRFAHASTKASDMSLREWFAGQALPALIKFDVEMSIDSGCMPLGHNGLAQIAINAFDIADAMIEASKEAK